MRRIGVMTYCHCQNYGAELQAYALQETLRRIGWQSEIIQFERTPITRQQKCYKVARAIFTRIRRRPFHGWGDVMKIMLQPVMRRLNHPSREALVGNKLRSSRFEEFWATYENHTEKIDAVNLSDLNYDVLIAGSDQIWNWLQTGDMSPYFLMFGSEECRKLSYAASLSESYIPRKYRDIYVSGLKNLDFVSVRESLTQAELQKLTSKPVEVVLDPTLLLTPSDWSEVWSDAIQIEEPYIFSYSLNESTMYAKKVATLASTFGMKVVDIRSSPWGTGRPEFINVFDAGPREFLYLLAHSKFVVTNSFHGTIFALNFHIPFLSLLNPVSGTNSRILSIVQELGVQDRAVCDADPCAIRNALLNEIDFDRVEKRRAVLDERSRRFLNAALPSLERREV